jgi:hypothetical protein
LTKAIIVLLTTISMVLSSINVASSHILNVYAQQQQGDGIGATTSTATTLVFKGNSFFIREL